MSSGTCDQLYLALRLASIHQHVEKAGPLPFTIDDVLINFDDVRAKAALDVLLTLAGQTQVILFTHHKRVVELARELDTDEVFVHHID